MLQEESYLCDAFMDPEKWLNKNEKQADEDLKESKTILQELKIIQEGSGSKMDDTVNHALYAVSKLKEVNKLSKDKMFVLESEKSLLEQDIATATSLEATHCKKKTSLRKTNLLLEGEKANLDTLTSRQKMSQETLSYLKQLSAPRHQLVADRQKNLAKLTELKADLEQSSEVKCSFTDADSVNIVLFPSGNVEATNGDASLMVTLKFDPLKGELCDVKLSETVKGADDIIKEAKTSSDLIKLILDLKSLWGSSASLFSEIYTIRERHAVDWIQEEGILHLMVKKGSSVVCTLGIPEGYPRSGPVTLDNIIGDTQGTDVTQIKVPIDSSLTGWIVHLETIFNKG